MTIKEERKKKERETEKQRKRERERDKERKREKERKKERKDTCTPMFIAALLTTAKTWNQSNCPLTAEQIKKMWYIDRYRYRYTCVHTMQYYSAIKKNEIMAALLQQHGWT